MSMEVDASTPSQPPKFGMLADLNADPPETDANDSSVHLTRFTSDEIAQDKTCNTAVEIESKRFNKLGKCRSRNSNNSSKLLDAGSLDYGPDADADQFGQSSISSREEKVSTLKTGLVHVARKMPKNAHAHFILGLMYQRLGQPQKAVFAYEKAEEILMRSEAEVARPELLSLVQIHHAQCILLESSADGSLEKELGAKELEEILSRLKESMQSDRRQAAVWNTLGLILMKSGRVQSAISVWLSLLAIDANNYDCHGNLGIAYFQSGNLELSAKCFQELVLKDQNHPAAFVNYAALILCKYGSVVAGAGANAGEGAIADHAEALNVAKECLLAALKVDPKAAHIWANLANAYYLTGDYRSSSKCLEKSAKLEPNCMSTRYAVAFHRIKDAERSQDPSEQLFWAGNEMASILREGEPVPIEIPIAWAGLSMVHKAHHEIAAAFETERNELVDVEERALYSLKQAIAEDPNDGMQWHQLGLHCLCSRQFETAQKYLKVAVTRFGECSSAWSNLGISVQLSEEPSQAEDVYKQALAWATPEQAHTMFSNLGNLYRQQKQYERAKAMFTKSLELQPGYAPAYNNLGLVFVAESRWEEARFCFDEALKADPLLDAAKSNMIKAMAMLRLNTA
ncbi:probable UDP-N-acetylglucosamine--peptide N-acetylglucosaminyltransferase SPINDLY [Mercurialis annua]|uniref:probable UDP-N-acetylglucosamine--peptide N-acetylglucosaminyltransferase SPINDLY n=1 Tax=Mercurialis annua TaxID=3986 RepID=UPI00215E86FD|nr:probable UDP-N-acetylglucosamine--peptide N-acetylglucosaminyltransferase SPINDLY [Mercurialis annua]XP_050224144.1 probable UDP-N-acetylglucosamine--peptide N-acetylglucosaminyltransferase SPINDLY [Mercurialis annua]